MTAKYTLLQYSSHLLEPAIHPYRELPQVETQYGADHTRPTMGPLASGAPAGAIWDLLERVRRS